MDLSKLWFGVNLPILIGYGFNAVDVLVINFYSILITHCNVLGNRNCPIPSRVRLVKQLTESWKIKVDILVLLNLTLNAEHNSAHETSVLTSTSNSFGDNRNHFVFTHSQRENCISDGEVEKTIPDQTCNWDVTMSLPMQITLVRINHSNYPLSEMIMQLFWCIFIITTDTIKVLI